MSNAERARQYRERQKANTPPNVLELIERGKAAKAELADRRRAELRLLQVQNSVASRLRTISLTISPASRARMLGELADWLADEQNRRLLDSFAPSNPMPRSSKSTMIPRWVPANLVEAWKKEWRLHGELAAAAKVRAMKREAGAA
jgi:hypothetical protein